MGSRHGVLDSNPCVVPRDGSGHLSDFSATHELAPAHCFRLHGKRHIRRGAILRGRCRRRTWKSCGGTSRLSRGQQRSRPRGTTPEVLFDASVPPEGAIYHGREGVAEAMRIWVGLGATGGLRCTSCSMPTTKSSALDVNRGVAGEAASRSTMKLRRVHPPRWLDRPVGSLSRSFTGPRSRRGERVGRSLPLWTKRRS